MVVGSPSAAPARRAASAFIGFTTNRKMASAISTKVISAFRKSPYFTVASPAWNASVVEVRDAQQAEQRREHVAHERGDDRAEGGPDHDRDRQVDDVAAQQEVAKLSNHRVPPDLSSGAVASIAAASG